MQLSKKTICFSFFIVSSASFMRQVVGFLRGVLKDQLFYSALGSFFILLGVIFFLYIFIVKLKGSLTKGLIIGLIFLGVGVLLWQIKIMEERIHIIEFAVLGWLAAADFRASKNIKRAFSACAICVLIGTLDELFQLILPYRVFDLRDILFNSTGAITGIILYVISSFNIKNITFQAKMRP